MKNYRLLVVISLTGACVLSTLVGCKKNIEPQTENKNLKSIMSSTVYAGQEGPTVLGRKLDNPYLISVMTQAKGSLDAEGIEPSRPFTVRPTHLYVKFIPKSDEELETLTADESLVLYDCPIDYEKMVVGNWYREPGLPEGMLTPQYASVKIGYTFPDIEHEIIDELYIPEEDELLIGHNTYAEHNQYENQGYVDRLLNVAYGLTKNNLEILRADLLDPIGGGIVGIINSPNGKVLINDTRLGRNIPMEGVEITANRWFTTHSGFVDANGDYYLDGSFKRPADYTIWFERSRFAIAKNRLQRAKIKISNIPDNHWSYTITDGIDRMHGHMFRAAYRYCYKDIGGLKRPFLDGIRKIIVVSQDNTGHYWGSGVNSVLLPYLFITRFRSDNTEYGSDEIYSTTTHEIAHTTHVMTMNGGPVQSSQVNGIIRESWAVGVEWFITGMEYRERGVPTYGDRTYNPTPPPQYPNLFAYQYWSINTIGSDYTSLFINLTDDFNELNVNLRTPQNPLWGAVNDPVRNYNLATIESQILKHVYGLSSLANQLKTIKPVGNTDTQIDLLLSHY